MSDQPTPQPQQPQLPPGVTQEQALQQKAFVEKTLHDVALAIYTRWAAAQGEEWTEAKGEKFASLALDASVTGCNGIYGWQCKRAEKVKPKPIQAFKPDEG